MKVTTAIAAIEDEDEDTDNEDDAYSHVYGYENLAKVVERGHLHVLKFLKEELNHHWGLQKYCIPAIEFGQLEILKWPLTTLHQFAATK